MSIIFKPTRLVGAIAIAMGFSSVSFADENMNPALTASLEPLVVTASRTEQTIETVPARISVISSQDIDQSTITSLPDLLMRDAAINVVQSGGYGQLTSIFMRGGNSNQTLVLKDGVRLNSATAGAASLAFIDTTDLDRIEVLKGPASVLYGSDAISGVVQLISKTPQKNSAFITGEGGENQTYKTVVGADVIENGIYAQIRGQRLETDGTPVKDIVDSPDAGYDQKGYSAKFGVDRKNYAVSLDVSENKGNSDYDNFGQLTNQDFKNQSINLKSRLNIRPDLEINTRLSQFKDELEQNDPNWAGSYDFVHSTTQEAEIYSKWDFTTHQNVSLGITHRNTDADAIVGGTAFNKSVDSTGYYIQHQYNHAGINSQVGVRLEDNENFGTHTVAQGGLRYQLLPLTSIYTNIGSAFKAPTLNDMYAFGGNPDLKPEKSLSYEIGIDQKLAYNLSTGLSLYSSKVDDLIDYDNSSNQMQNINKAKMQGGEAYVKWQGENLYANLGYNYVRAKDDSTKEDLSRRPRQNVSFTTGWEDQQYGFSTTILANGSYDNSAFDDIKVAGHMRVDMHGHYNLNPNVQLFANIQNVADSNYRTAYGSGSYYINGGRLATGGITLRY